MKFLLALSAFITFLTIENTGFATAPSLEDSDAVRTIRALQQEPSELESVDPKSKGTPLSNEIGETPPEGPMNSFTVASEEPLMTEDNGPSSALLKEEVMNGFTAAPEEAQPKARLMTEEDLAKFYKERRAAKKLAKKLKNWDVIDPADPRATAKRLYKIAEQLTGVTLNLAAPVAGALLTRVACNMLFSKLGPVLVERAGKLAADTVSITYEHMIRSDRTGLMEALLKRAAKMTAEGEMLRQLGVVMSFFDAYAYPVVLTAYRATFVVIDGVTSVVSTATSAVSSTASAVTSACRWGASWLSWGSSTPATEVTV